MLSLICAWINGWVNNHEAGDLRCHCSYYDVTLMIHSKACLGLHKRNTKTLHYWTFVREIYWVLVDSPHKWPVMQTVLFHVMTSSCSAKVSVPRMIFRLNSKFSINICSALVWNMPNWSWQNFVHVTAVLLSWHVQNFVMISQICCEQEYYKDSLNFKYYQNIVSGKGARMACSQHNIPNCMKEVTWLKLCLGTNGHRSGALGWLPFILLPVFVQAAVIRS